MKKSTAIPEFLEESLGALLERLGQYIQRYSVTTGVTDMLHIITHGLPRINCVKQIKHE